MSVIFLFFFFQAEDGIRDDLVTGVQTCALPILLQAYYVFSISVIVSLYFTAHLNSSLDLSMCVCIQNSVQNQSI